MGLGMGWRLAEVGAGEGRGEGAVRTGPWGLMGVGWREGWAGWKRVGTKSIWVCDRSWSSVCLHTAVPIFCQESIRMFAKMIIEMLASVLS